MIARLLLALALVAGAAQAADSSAGLVLELTAADGETSDARVTRLAALAVPEGAPVSPLLGTGPFKAVFRGTLSLPLRTRLEFRITGRGRARLMLEGELLLEVEGEDLGQVTSEMQRVPKGESALRLEYESPAEGDARVVLLWSGRDFSEEQVPPSALTHDLADGVLTGPGLLRRGRELFARSRCARCHAWKDTPPHLMPELADDATSFAGMRERLRPEWIAAWVVDPRGLRAAATMPAVLGVESLAAAAAAKDTRPWDLAAFLGAPDPAGAPTDASAATTGAALFDALGCIGCHALGSPGDDRISLEDAGWKFVPGAISAFLQAPRTHRASSPMPDFGLTAAEADALESFLRTRARARPAHAAVEDAPAGDPERGRELARQLGCASCHEESKDQSELRAPTLDEIFQASWAEGGCARGGAGLPDFDLGQDELVALETLRVAGVDALGHDPAVEAEARLMGALRCDACHSRDGITDRWSLVATETLDLRSAEERPALEQRRPDLTWSGDKLQEGWIVRTLERDARVRARPFLEARMPGFPQYAAVIARGLAAEHGHLPGGTETRPAATDEQRRTLGRKLTGFEGGFACLTCHPIAGQPGLVQFEMGAIDLDLAPGRLRPDYVRRWLLDPTRIDPATKMPRFVDAEGKTALTSVLDGDGRAQMEAILAFLLGPR